MDKRTTILGAMAIALMSLLSSCHSEKSLIVPHGVSTADAIPAAALNLQSGSYEILNTVNETASVFVTYSGTRMKIESGDGDFSYSFKFDSSKGWKLDKFKGVATFGYLLSDTEGAEGLPNAEEFARRVAIARLIESVKDLGADGVLEPIVTTRASNVNGHKVEYQASVRAKIIKINSTTK